MLKKAPYITGLYGCSCHPFSTWEECDRETKKKLVKGDLVKNRHTGNSGSVHEVKDGGYCIVNYGNLPGHKHLEHAAGLLKTSEIQTKLQLSNF